MGNIFKVLRRDFLRLFKGAAAWVILFGMVFIPPLYSWYNIVGFWDPYGNTKGITVAIANNDDGTDNALIGKQNLGDQIVKQMRSNDQLGWTFVTEAEAMDQVESGKAYAAIIIPKDFSDDLAGVVTGGKSRPTLEYYVNEKASAIAPKVTDVARPLWTARSIPHSSPPYPKYLPKSSIRLTAKPSVPKTPPKPRPSRPLPRPPTMCSTHAAPSPSSPPNSPTPQSRHAPHVRRWTTRATLGIDTAEGLAASPP